MYDTDWYPENYLSYADQVLALSNGQIKCAATYAELLQDGLLDVVDTTRTNDAENIEIEESRDKNFPSKWKENSHPNHDGINSTADDARATGEWSTYKYYFKSIGLRDGSLFVVMTALSSFFMSFGSEW